MGSRPAESQSCEEEQDFHLGKKLTPFILGGVTETTNLACSKEHYQAQSGSSSRYIQLTKHILYIGSHSRPPMLRNCYQYMDILCYSVFFFFLIFTILMFISSPIYKSILSMLSKYIRIVSVQTLIRFPVFTWQNNKYFYFGWNIVDTKFKLASKARVSKHVLWTARW